MVSKGDGSDDDVRCRERDEEHHKTKVKEK
jgi:hypothetical protein